MKGAKRKWKGAKDKIGKYNKELSCTHASMPRTDNEKNNLMKQYFYLSWQEGVSKAIMFREVLLSLRLHQHYLFVVLKSSL